MAASPTNVCMAVLYLADVPARSRGMPAAGPAARPCMNGCYTIWEPQDKNKQASKLVAGKRNTQEKIRWLPGLPSRVSLITEPASPDNHPVAVAAAGGVSTQMS